MTSFRILVLGASGYIGQHLIPRLTQQGHYVRAAARRIAWLQEQAWSNVECQYIDLYQPETLPHALADIDIVYYLVHGMGDGSDFFTREIQAAHHFSQALGHSGVQQVIYLGATQPSHTPTSHLMARQQTGEILRQSGIPITELRASMIVGPGSAAFEVMRDMVYNLPLLTPPRWVRSKSSPIALDNLLTYLSELLQHPGETHRIFDAAGPEYLSYQTLFMRFIQLSGKKRWIIPLPIPIRFISVYFLNLITSVPTSLSRALIEGLKHDLLADSSAIEQLIPQILIPFEQAVQKTLQQEATAVQSAEWGYDPDAKARWRPGYGFYPKQAGYCQKTTASTAALWNVIQQIGGKEGYFYANFLWKLRAQIDDLLGNKVIYGRPAYHTLALKDVIDSWKVISLKPQQQLTLLFGMKAPGLGRLTFTIVDLGGQRHLDVRAYWHPAGANGLLYWFAMMPAHLFIFRGMSKRIAYLAEISSSQEDIVA